MNLVSWNPFREFDHVFARGFLAENGAGNAWLPAVDVRESDDAYRVDVDLPAVAPEDVDVSFKNGVLTISGERTFSSSHENGSVHRRERRSGKFTRSFRLPEDADEDAIEAKADRGVVTITVAKREKAKPRIIEVKVH